MRAMITVLSLLLAATAWAAWPMHVIDAGYSKPNPGLVGADGTEPGTFYFPGEETTVLIPGGYVPVPYSPNQPLRKVASYVPDTYETIVGPDVAIPVIATGWEEGKRIRLACKIDGLWTPVTVATVNYPEDAVPGQLTTIVAGESITENVVVYACEGGPLGRTLGIAFAPADVADLTDSAAWTQQTIATGELFMKVALCDYDQDGDTDIIVGTKTELNGGTQFYGKVLWFENDGGSFTQHFICNAGWVMGLIADDLDGDEYPDILYSDRGKNSMPFAGMYSVIAGTKRLIGGAGRVCMFFDYVDADGDGDRDIVLGESQHAVATFYRPADPTAAWPTTRYSFPAAVKAVTGQTLMGARLWGANSWVVSYDGATGTRAGVAIVSNTGTVVDVSGTVGQKYDFTFLADMDGDEDMDIVTSYQLETPGNVVWYEQPNP